MAMVASVAAPAWAAPDPEAAQFTCDLTGDCDTATAEPAGANGAAPASAVPGRPAPRGSATRGFSFKRASTEGQTASAPVAPAAAPVKPVRVGSADLGLAFEPASAVLTAGSKMRLNKYAAALSSRSWQAGACGSRGIPMPADRRAPTRTCRSVARRRWRIIWCRPG